MTDPSSLSTVLGLIQGAHQLEPPVIEAVKSVIRSGDQFLIGGQTETLPSKDTSLATTGQSKYLGGVVIEWGYDVDPDLSAAFHRWLEDNEDELRGATPQGAHYWGTYAVFAESQQSLGLYRTVWAYENFAALSKINEQQTADPSSRFAVLMGELTAFRDRRIGAGRSQQIYQPAAFTKRT